MSRRYRKRREERILNSELITESAPRGLTQPLPRKPEVRVRPVYDTKPLDRQFGDLPRIDSGKIVQDLRRLHIKADLAQGVTPNFHRYNYERVKIGRDEKVLLPSSHPYCQEREERRQILFARNKTGKRGQNAPILPRLIVKCERKHRGRRQ